MNLLEAIKSGKKFKRKIWNYFAEGVTHQEDKGNWYDPLVFHMQNIHSYSNIIEVHTTIRAVSLEDLLAEDYEVKDE